MTTIPDHEIPSHLHLDIPIARSSDLAIGIGPIQVYKGHIVLRFEGSDLSTTRRNRPVLSPTRRDTEAYMSLTCTAQTEGVEQGIDAVLIKSWSNYYSGRVTNYFSVATPVELKSLRITYSYDAMGIPATTATVNGEALASHRALIQTIRAGANNG